MKRILYSGTKNASSWAFRAWLALREANIDFEERVVDIRRPQRFENLNRIGEFSPPAAVPVLVDGESVIFDSLAIMEYANEIGGGGLLPADVKRRARARSFLAWQHSGLSGICARLSFESSFYPDRRAMTFDEQHQAARLYGVCEEQLAHGGGPYLFGALSLADLMFVPTVLRLTTHTPSLERWPAVRVWADELLSRETVREWLAVAYEQPVVRLADYLP